MAPRHCRFCSPCLILAFALVAASPGHAQDTRPAPEPGEPFSGMAGEDLVKSLLDGDTCSRAFYELWRRADPDEDKGYDAFLESHYDPEVIVCPQGEDRSPLYVVLYGFLSRTPTFPYSHYDTPDPQTLFPDLDASSFKSWDTPAIAVFTHDGEETHPFRGSTVLDPPGLIADINGDALVERADSASYTSGADVFQVCVVRPEPEPLLTVLYNWGREEWSYRFTDSDKDGVLDIELGPKTGDGIKPKVAYRWDKIRKEYVGPEGSLGDHFRRLEVRNTWDMWKQLEKLSELDLVFPKDEDFVDDLQASLWGDWNPWRQRGEKEPSAAEVSKPYHYVSLKSLTNEEIAHYMARGKTMYNLECEAILKTHLPEGFWTLPPQDAALALADANRYPEHRKRFHLAVDARDGRQPPATCSVSFSFASSRDYVALDRHYFLRADAEESYLAFAESERSGRAYYNVVHDQRAYDFRYCELDYAEARRIAHTIWWLNRVRTWPNSSDDASGVFCTADGAATLVLPSDEGDEHLHVADSIWADQVAERWSEQYTKETFLNLAAFLFTHALPERLGERWSRFEPAFARDVESRQTGAPQYTEDELSRLHSFTKLFIERFTPDERLVSLLVVTEAVRAAGDFAYADLAPALRDVQQRAPEPTRRRRTYKEISAEIQKLHAEELDAESADAEERQERLAHLYEESHSIIYDLLIDSPGRLRESLALALRKLDVADDAQRVQDWACSDEPGWQWALQRLARQDRPRYVAALEWRLHKTEGERARQIFDEIARTDPQRAAGLAAEMPPDKQGHLSMSTFALLESIGAMEDEAESVEALIRVALDPEAGWEQRTRAVELLVPQDDPLRYPGQEVDDALVAMLDPELADELMNYPLGAACRALASRGRTDCFDRIYERLKTLADIGDSPVYFQTLGALTQMAQSDPPKFNPRLVALLKPHLERTNQMMTAILWSTWAADLRELKPDLERIATSSPEDYEDPKAYGFGGSVTPVEGRFHLARKIVAIWNEEDPATGAKLLVAFGLVSLGEGSEPELLTQWERQLSVAGQALTPEQAKDVNSFINWCQQQHIQNDLERASSKAEMEFSERARRWLGL